MVDASLLTLNLLRKRDNLSAYPQNGRTHSNNSSPISLKQFVGKLVTNCLSVFDHFVKLVLKGLTCMWLLLKVSGTLTILKKKNCVLINSVQEIIEIEA